MLKAHNAVSNVSVMYEMNNFKTLYCGGEDEEAKADSTRALKTRQLRRLTKRAATPTEFSNEELYKNSRSNLDERF